MPIDQQTLALFFLATVAAGGVAWVFIYPMLSGEAKAEKRMASVARAEPTSRTVAQRGAQRTRREQVEESLKELEMRQARAKRPPLPMRINQAGLSLSKQQFILISAALGLIAFAALLHGRRRAHPRARRRVRRRRRRAAMASGLPEEAAGRQIPRGVSRCRRRHRARRQGRPAAARMPQDREQ